MHSFIRECAALNSVSHVCLSVSKETESIIGAVTVKDTSVLKDILAGNARLPLENKKALRYLQDQDKDFVRVKELLTSGQ